MSFKLEVVEVLYFSPYDIQIIDVCLKGINAFILSSRGQNKYNITIRNMLYILFLIYATNC